MKIITKGRTGLEDFFKLSGVLEHGRLKHTPFLIFIKHPKKVEVEIIDNLEDLLTYPDNTPVMKQWSGRWSSDFFQFTVGDAKKAHWRKLALDKDK